MMKKTDLDIIKSVRDESRVSRIQTKPDSVLNINSRVSAIENVVKLQNDKLKLIDTEARSTRRNLLFKGIPDIGVRTVLRWPETSLALI